MNCLSIFLDCTGKNYKKTIIEENKNEFESNTDRKVSDNQVKESIIINNENIAILLQTNFDCLHEYIFKSQNNETIKNLNENCGLLILTLLNKSKVSKKDLVKKFGETIVRLTDARTSLICSVTNKEKEDTREDIEDLGKATNDFINVISFQDSVNVLYLRTQFEIFNKFFLQYAETISFAEPNEEEIKNAPCFKGCRRILYEIGDFIDVNIFRK